MKMCFLFRNHLRVSKIKRCVLIKKVCSHKNTKHLELDTLLLLFLCNTNSPTLCLIIYIIFLWLTPDIFYFLYAPYILSIPAFKVMVLSHAYLKGGGRVRFLFWPKNPPIPSLLWPPPPCEFCKISPPPFYYVLAPFMVWMSSWIIIKIC